MERRKIRDREDAESCLNAALACGQTPTEWAHANGVNARSLHGWRLLFQGIRTPVPFRVVELVAPAAPTVGPPMYTVRCGVFAVEVPRDFDDAVLGRLLRVVSAC